MFLNLLSSKDRDALRSVVKRIHLAHHPSEFVTDYEADRVIEVLGPEVAEKLIRNARS